MSRTLFMAALVVLIVRPAFASIEIRVCSDTAGEVQCIPAPVIFQLVTAHIVITGTDALSSASFSVSYPPRLLWLEDQPIYSQTSGQSPTGVTVAFDGCVEPPVHVMSVQFLTTGSGSPFECQWAVVMDPSATDCSSEPVLAAGGTSRVPPGTCVITGPSDPSPADQAQNVPLDVSLEWSTVAATGGCNLGEILYQSLYFGTTPDPPLVLQMIAFPPEDPGDLQPGTQYHWRVYATQFFTGSMGPVWTFRTAGTTATEPTTWGRVKALYRR